MEHTQDAGAFLAESRQRIRALKDRIASAPDETTAAVMREKLDRITEADRAEYERLVFAQKPKEMEETK